MYKRQAFLDAYAQHLRTAGFPAQSLAWGPWTPDEGMTAQLATTDHARVSRGGMHTLTAEQGLALFDAALAGGEPQPLAVRFDTTALREQARAGTLVPLLRGLVTAPMRRQADSGQRQALRQADALAGLTGEELEQALLDLVRSEAALVLGHGSVDGIDPERGFLDLGFDSLTALEFRNRLGTATGLRLTATVIFDHPSPAALAVQLRTLLEPEPGPETPAEAPAAAQAVSDSEIDAMELDKLVQFALESADL